MLKSANEQVSALMSFLNENPDKFNNLFEDKNVEMKAFIESLISRGELIRSNMNEAVAYFNNPNNKAVLEAMQNKYKLF